MFVLYCTNEDIPDQAGVKIKYLQELSQVQRPELVLVDQVYMLSKWHAWCVRIGKMFSIICSHRFFSKMDHFFANLLILTVSVISSSAAWIMQSFKC